MSGIELSQMARPSRSKVLRGVPRLGLILAMWAVGGAFFALCTAVTLPYLFGLRSLTVLSGSMEPTIRVGDVVVVHQISPLAARIGDVVTFRDPEDDERLITHRVRDISVSGSNVTIETKGDANSATETWTVDADGTIGRVEYRVPKMGYALFWIRGRYGRLVLVVVPALLLGAYELWRIWRPVRAAEIEQPKEDLDAAAA